MFSLRSPYRYNTSLKVTETKATSPIRLNAYGASTAADLDDKMEQNYRRLGEKYVKYMNATDSRPTEARRHVIGELNRSLRACLDVELTSIGDVASSEGTLYFTKPGHPNRFEFNVLSSGEKEVVDILLDLYLRQEIYTDTVFLLDEPELHVSTAIQSKLMIEIEKLIGDNCQLWIATHSIGFLRALQGSLKDKCQIIRFEDEATFAATKRTLTPMKKTIANWRSVFSIALQDLSELVSPRQIIYCEGKDQPGKGGLERGLDARVFNAIFSEKYHDTLFISSGGNTELDQRSDIALTILSKVFAGVEVLVLKDRDMASGRATTQADRKFYLDNNPKNHRVLVRWEIENYLYDRAVLQQYCAVNKLVFDEAKFDRLVRNIDDDNVKDHTAAMKGICGVITSVGVDQFKLNLAGCISEGMSVYAELEACIFKG